MLTVVMSGQSMGDFSFSRCLLAAISMQWACLLLLVREKVPLMLNQDPEKTFYLHRIPLS